MIFDFTNTNTALSLLIISCCRRCIELLDSSDPVQASKTATQIPDPASASSETYYCPRNMGIFEGLSNAIRTRSLPLTSNGGQLGPGLTSTDAKIMTVSFKFSLVICFSSQLASIRVSLRSGRINLLASSWIPSPTPLRSFKMVSTRGFESEIRFRWYKNRPSFTRLLHKKSQTLPLRMKS